MYSALTLCGDKGSTVRQYISLSSTLSGNGERKELLNHPTINRRVRALLICNIFVNSFILDFPALRLLKLIAEGMALALTFKNKKTQSRPFTGAVVLVSDRARYPLSTLSIFQDIWGLETTGGDNSSGRTKVLVSDQGMINEISAPQRKTQTRLFVLNSPVTHSRKESILSFHYRVSSDLLQYIDSLIE